jgi:hypothetical protein
VKKGGEAAEETGERESLRVFGQCILLYLQLYFIYYRSGCGRRQVAEPPKIMCVVSFYFGSIIALFYHPTVPNGLRFIVL